MRKRVRGRNPPALCPPRWLAGKVPPVPRGSRVPALPGARVGTRPPRPGHGGALAPGSSARRSRAVPGAKSPVPRAVPVADPALALR